jgi:hypothetical protein
MEERDRDRAPEQTRPQAMPFVMASSQTMQSMGSSSSSTPVPGTGPGGSKGTRSPWDDGRGSGSGTRTPISGAGPYPPFGSTSRPGHGSTSTAGSQAPTPTPGSPIHHRVRPSSPSGNRSPVRYGSSTGASMTGGGPGTQTSSTPPIHTSSVPPVQSAGLLAPQPANVPSGARTSNPSPAPILYSPRARPLSANPEKVGDHLKTFPPLHSTGAGLISATGSNTSTSPFPPPSQSQSDAYGTNTLPPITKPLASYPSTANSSPSNATTPADSKGPELGGSALTEDRDVVSSQQNDSKIQSPVQPMGPGKANTGLGSLLNSDTGLGGLSALSAASTNQDCAAGVEANSNSKGSDV